MVYQALILVSLLALGVAGCTDEKNTTPSKPDDSKTTVLTIPEGAALCSGFSEGLTWQQELAIVGQVRFSAPEFPLPRVEGKQQVPHFVEAVLHGPDRTRYTPSGVVECEVKRLGQLEQAWTYIYRMSLSGPRHPATLKIVVFLSAELSESPTRLSLDALGIEKLGSVTARVQLGGPPDDTVYQKYAPCELGKPVEVLEGVTAGADKVHLELGSGPFSWDGGCYASGHTICLFLTSATITLGQQSQIVTDRFRLIYVGNHHNWDDEYLILLEPPLGTTAALLVQEPPLSSSRGELRYLDAAMTVIKTEALDWNWGEGP